MKKKEKNVKWKTARDDGMDAWGARSYLFSLFVMADPISLIIQDKGERDRAIADFTQALRITPNDAGARRNLNGCGAWAAERKRKEKPLFRKNG
ncbi:MAG: tetratricopeptide repeat protein [Treponema sp.]|jgi:hypothetical protein|nr:tetratricopeptide repeat protein [Treponema sp.]